VRRRADDPVDAGFWSQKQTRVGVARVAAPSAAAFKEGPQGLLDVAINGSMASDLERHLATLAPEMFEPGGGSVRRAVAASAADTLRTLFG
jgi:hypothetical protein